MWSFALLTALLPLLGATSPVPATELAARNKNPPYYRDPECPAGTTPGFEFFTARYDVPAKEFYAKVGSFYDEVWYIGLPPNRTVGPDNTVGSIREIDFAGTILHEQLIKYTAKPTLLELQWHLVNGPINVTGAVADDPPDEVVLFGSYTEDLRVESICAGKATFITFTGRYCFDKPGPAYKIFDVAHSSSIEAVAQGLNATLIQGNGTCPS
ncbi:hypothetical protein PSEUBRA_001646 [Kalmanozyma brasiliensis GHG001]|uniref:Uncharacterized protein n=1 Tax=Kalmanozyma brasiliensis (strain GHG001) TaxID=1365824 RepID=V5EDP5_KALBG|nr:uncharacterized protein PSEUBRA_001646 [Kalmanozyma brasiliensis GHG001]EST08576.1 hypothetical protein PSEUBRA_001646 [Kalmanozyma brasiliensis GHG001]